MQLENSHVNRSSHNGLIFVLISVVLIQFQGAQSDAVEQTRSLSNIVTAISAQLALVLNMQHTSPLLILLKYLRYFSNRAQIEI